MKGAKRLGVRAGNWLTREQAEQLLALPNRTTHKGKRDLAILALLVGSGLRREELAGLRIEEIQQRDGRWCVVDIAGKGRRIRTVAMPTWAKAAVDVWLAASGFSSGLLLGAVNKGDRITGQGMSAESIYAVVEGYRGDLGAAIAPMTCGGHSPSSPTKAARPSNRFRFHGACLDPDDRTVSRG